MNSTYLVPISIMSSSPYPPNSLDDWDDLFTFSSHRSKIITSRYRIPSSDTQDVIQDSLLITWREKDNIKSSLRGYFIGTLARQCIMYWRRRHCFVPSHYEIQLDPDQYRRICEDKVAIEPVGISRLLISDILSLCRPKEAKILTLRAIGVKDSEIVECKELVRELGISTTAGLRKKRGKLRRRLKNEHGIELKPGRA